MLVAYSFLRRARLARAISLALAASALAGAPARAVPLLSEFYYDAVGSDDGLSFVEIYAPAGTLLDGFTIEGVNGSGGAIGPVIALSGSVSASGLFVVADVDAGGLTNVAIFDLLANFDFQNGPDSVVLRDANGIVDALAYGVFAPGDVVFGEGTPAVDAPAGSSLARVFADVDTNDNAVDFVALATPTPGQASFAPVPEPGTGVLAAIGLAGLAWSGGRRR